MKNLQIFNVLFIALLTLSCSKDDDNQNSDSQTEAQEPKFQATINGGSFTNYPFELGVYEITRGTNGNTISINVADTQGQSINLFLNGTDGFSNGTVKEIGNIDSDDFTTHAVIRDQQAVITYFSSSGSITVTNNRAHPSKSGYRLISGNYSIMASSIDNVNTTELTGSFTELEFENQ